MAATAVDRPTYSQAARLDRIAFWTPLPETDELSDFAGRLVRESDLDMREGRYESALDAAIALNASAPEFIPGFIRTAELLIATQRKGGARSILQSVIRREELYERDRYELALSKIHAHVVSDADLVYELAHQILSNGNRDLTVPYVPAAIQKLTDQERYTDAIDIANSWTTREPASPLALGFLVRAHLFGNDSSSAFQTIRRFRDDHNADKLWPENIVVSALVAITSNDMEPKWMAAGPVCQALRDGVLNYSHVTDVLEFLVPAVDSSQRALLYAGLLALNAGDREESRAIFQTTPADSPIESFLQSVGLERTLEAANDHRTRFQTLKEIWKGLGNSQVAAVATESEIFEPPATRTTVGLAIARALRDNESYSEALKLVNDLIRSGQKDPEIFRLQAEIMDDSGSRDDALQAFESLVEQQEMRHQYADAIDTLEAMIRIAPGNLRLRARIVDNCLKVGRFDQAIEQLVAQGRMYHKAGKLSEAEPPVHRAIEIATMTTDWDKVDKLHRLLISFAPEETRLRHSAVTTYVQYGRTQDAIDQLRKIVSIARKQNDLDEAIAASHQMLALGPDDPATYHQLGELLVAIQEYNQADRVYRRLANLVPDDHAVKAKRSAIAALTRSRKSSN
jgi:tetratricopeptide (TPR) repeat protein